MQAERIAVGAFLIIHGEVEVGPGRFEPGIVSSRPFADADAAEREWQECLARGLYEEPFETHEVRVGAPTFGELACPTCQEQESTR